MRTGGWDGLSQALNRSGDILLVAVNYDKKEKKHECMIEKAVL